MKALPHAAALLALLASQAHAAPIDIAQTPIFVSSAVPPLNMLVMGRDHKLYYEAYNDASDLDGDGVLDIGYKPAIDYYGYFNGQACYSYQNSRFEPTSAAGGSDGKQCSNAWSGNFLNYLATSRMDALRKVLYGGYRVTDSTSQTILRTAFIPQDAHSWGKEYDPGRDGYDIANYAPLSNPGLGYRHLFAVTTLSDGGIPQLRVLTNTSFRAWDWVSKEGPVASDHCRNNNTLCTSGGSTNGWQVVPPTYFRSLTLTTWRDSSGTSNNQNQMNTLFNGHPAATRCGSSGVSSIDTTGSNNNPFTANSCGQDNYHTLIEGTLRVPETGTYEFGVNGDDAVDFYIGSTRVAYWYGGHGANANQPGGTTGTISLMANTDYTIKFRHEEAGGGDNWQLYWKSPSSGPSTLTNHNLDILVCPSNATLRNDTCKPYSNNGSTLYKPTGILHDFGENGAMKFGLLTGSYQKNTAGGVVRSNIAEFSREVDPVTGQFKSGINDGIVANINKLRITDFNYSNYQYNNCGWIGNGAITLNEHLGKCSMWGNPVAEMMYETMRYFANASSAHPDYSYDGNAKDTKAPLNLSAPSWVRPYTSEAAGGGGNLMCAKPVMTVLSDINPSYDSTLPGSHWQSLDNSGDPASIRSFNVSTETDEIGSEEGLNGDRVFIGESNDVKDSAPTSKLIQGLSSVRGLAPEEPSKEGTYYSAGVAKYAAENKITGSQKMMTYAVALASPLPTIKFPVGANTVTLVPFAKSVGGGYGIGSNPDFMPTDQIVDYYVVTIANTNETDIDTSVNGGRAYAQFRINYEDVEQGADHDMDAIALYTLSVEVDGTLKIEMKSEYASGGIIQHMGYVISGTTQDGIYLEVRDVDTSEANSVSYALNTPPNQAPGWCASNGATEQCRVLPLAATRTFSASGTAGASLLKDPLWYAAKYGMPERDPADVEGDPDNYFLVTNALTLKDQLTNAFNDIMQKNTAVTRPAVGRAPNGGQITDNRDIYRTEFQIGRWSGDLIKETLNVQNNQRNEIWRASENMPASRSIKMANTDGDGLQNFTWKNLAGRTFNGKGLQDRLNRNQTDAIDDLGPDRVDFIKGDRSKEGDVFRLRDSLLGDIVNSSPVIVAGAQYLGYLADAIDGTAGIYEDFQKANGSCPVTQNADGSTTVTPGPTCRESMIYVGANDGMLHGFDAHTGEERFAFIPTAVIEHLNKLTFPDYVGSDSETSLHQYYVDGSLVVRDVYFDSAWHTVLIGTLGAGGRGAFALDVTNPAAISLLWEFTSDSVDSLSDPANPDSLSDLGYTFGTPLIARLHSGQWGVLLNNGYNSPNAESGKAVLYVLDVKTGELIRKLDAPGTAGNNGLSTPRGADNNGDGVLDYVYAGDLQGNMWRFDLLRNNRSESTPFTRDDDTDSAKLDFEVSFGGAPLYKAINASGTAQPITTPPSLVRHPSRKGYLVLFGTGRYLANQDKIAPYSMQSLYGIWDTQTKGEAASTTELLDRDNLLQQAIRLQNMDATIGDEETSTTSLAIRLLTKNNINWAGQENPATAENGDVLPEHWGWYLDLALAETNEETTTLSDSIGERMVDEMAARGQVLLLSTRTPNENPCEAGVEGWLYGINPFTGSATDFNVFDLNNDRVIDGNDGYNSDGARDVISSYKVPAGSFTLSDSKLLTPDGAAIDVNFGPNSSGRQNWYIVNPTAEEEASE